MKILACKYASSSRDTCQERRRASSGIAVIESLWRKRANRGSCKCKTEIDSSFVDLHFDSWHFDALAFEEQRRTRMPSYASYTRIVCTNIRTVPSLTIKGAIKRPAKTRGSIILESVPLIENRFSLTEAHRSTVNRLIDRFVRPINRFDCVEPCRRGYRLADWSTFLFSILPDYHCQSCFPVIKPSK